MVDKNTPLHPGERPEGISLLMVVPALLGVAVLAAIAGLAWKMTQPGQAGGDRVLMRFETACPTQVGPVVLRRATDIGLGDPEVRAEGHNVLLVATLPGMVDDRSAVPTLLARPGTLLVSAKDGPVLTEADLDDASFDLDEGGTPITQLRLMPIGRQRVEAILLADPGGALTIVVDGEALADRPNSIALEGDRLRLPSGDGDNLQRARRAADRAISLSSGPLPCPIALVGIDPVAG